MKVIMMWCQLVLANGDHVTIKVPALLTYHYQCDTVMGNEVCRESIRVKHPEQEYWISIPENMCFYKNPKENK